MNHIPIVLNGQAKSIQVQSLDKLIKELGIDTKYLAIAINNEVIPSADYPQRILQAQDQIEFIQPVCGG